MHTSRLALGLFCLAALCLPVRAEDAPAKEPAAAAAEAARWSGPPEARHPATAAEFEPKADALPKHVKRLDGTPGTTVKAQKFRDDPIAKGLVEPAPVRVHAFGLQAEGGEPGTVFVYEYEEAPPPNLEAYWSLLFWVIDDAPTKAHPEQTFVTGRYGIVLSFPYGDPGAEWFKEHLRSQFAIPARALHPESADLLGAMLAALESDDPAAALAAYDKSPDAAAKDAECLRIAGTCARMLEDWPRAEQYYRAAFDLLRDLRDPLPPPATYNVLTWLGYATLYQQKYDDAITAFRKAHAYGVPREVEGSAVWGPYNIACACSLAGRLDDAVAALRAAIEVNAEIKEHAREDADLAKLRERDDVKALLAD